MSEPMRIIDPDDRRIVWKRRRFQLRTARPMPLFLAPASLFSRVCHATRHSFQTSFGPRSADRPHTRGAERHGRATSRARNREKSRESRGSASSSLVFVWPLVARLARLEATDGTPNGGNRRRKKRLAFTRIRDISRTPRLLNT